MLIEKLGKAIQEQSLNIVPDGMNEISVNVGEGKITSSIMFKNLLLDDESLWLKAHCQWGAHLEGKSDYIPRAIIHATRAFREAERSESDIVAFVDTSLIDNFLEVIWFVTPNVRVLASQELHLGTALVSMLQHFPGWKARKEKLVVHLNHTSEPPTIKASNTAGLYADIKVATTLTLDPEASKQEGGDSFTPLKVEVAATSEVIGPTFDHETGTFDFDVRGLDIKDIVVLDYRDSHMSKWLTKFLDHALVHRHEKDVTFLHWWEKEGSIAQKCQHALDAFHEYFMDCLREKVDEAITNGLKLANDVIDEQISQFVLPTGDFDLIGHNIHVEAQEITADMDNDIVEVVAHVSLDDSKKAKVKLDNK